jgi:uncharacterized protein
MTTQAEHKAFGVVEFKTDDDEPGTFEAIVAVFGNVDRGGDVLEPGAFKKTLGRSGRGLPPVVWSHNWDEPPIGVTLEAEEVEKGLRIKGRLFVEENDLARKVYAAMKARGGDGRPPLREFSFGYSAVKAKFVETDEQIVRHLKEVELFEVGPTLVGMNPATELLGVKQHQPSPPDGGKNENDEDKPPNAPSVEEAARIRSLLAEQPRVVTTPD